MAIYGAAAGDAAACPFPHRGLARGDLLRSLAAAAAAGGRLAFGLFLQAQRSDLVRIGAVLGDELILDAENQIVMFPLRGNRRVVCGVEGVLGARFDFRDGAYRVSDLATAILRLREGILTPHGSIMTPQGSILTPHGSILTLHGSILMPHGSILTLHGSILMRHGSILMPQAGIRMPREGMRPLHAPQLSRIPWPLAGRAGELARLGVRMRVRWRAAA